MPKWNEKTKTYEEEDLEFDRENVTNELKVAQREERFRTALLTELYLLTTAIDMVRGKLR